MTNAIIFRESILRTRLLLKH